MCIENTAIVLRPLELKSLAAFALLPKQTKLSTPIMSSYRTVPVFSSQERRRPRPERRSSATTIFEALDEASWAAVRRIVSADAEAVKGRKCSGTLSLSPLDYALQLISDSSAVLDHCDRSGVPDSTWAPSSGSQPMSLRGRLSALAHICVVMLATPEFDALPEPNPSALQLALQARLAPLSMALLRKYPQLAATRLKQSQKTSLHVLASSIGSAAPSSWLASSCLIAKEILDTGYVFASDVDASGRNALHDLCTGLSSSSQPYGLFGLTPRSRTSLQGVKPFVQLLISHGALPCHQDFSGETPIGIAVRSLDYTTLLVAADKIFQDIVEAHTGMNSSSARAVVPNPNVTGLQSLPEDVIRLVMAKSSPRDAVHGVGASCRGLRRIALSPELWRELAIAHTSAHARDRGSHLSVHSPAFWT